MGGLSVRAMVEFDSDRLFRLAQEKSSENRTELARIIADLFEQKEGTLSDRERSLMFHILRTVVHDVEMSVRKTLSEHLAAADDAPHDLITLLASDEIEVAYPILSRSRVLHDSDLVEVIRHRTLEHQLAIAIRQNVSEEVSGALVEAGDPNVVQTLLNNPNAKISGDTMEYLVEQSKRLDAFQEPLLRRNDLHQDLAQRMFLWVSAALRQHIMENYDLDQETMDELLEKVAFQELDATHASRTVPTKSRRLADDLEDEGLATHEMLLGALREGEVSLFVAMFCRLTDLRETLVMRMLFEPGGEGLAIACKAIGMGKAVFASIFTLSRKARPKAMQGFKREIRAILHLYDQMTEEAAQKVLHKWQRTSVYLAAIRELELGSRNSD